jgi:hypothetical protein
MDVARRSYPRAATIGLKRFLATGITLDAQGYVEAGGLKT